MAQNGQIARKCLKSLKKIASSVMVFPSSRERMSLIFSDRKCYRPDFGPDLLTATPMSSKALAIPKAKRLPAAFSSELQEAMDAWLGRLEPHTYRAYFRSWVHFALWLEAQEGVQLGEAPASRSPERAAWENRAVKEAAKYLLSLGSTKATWTVEIYLRQLLYPKSKKKGYARRTVHMRLASLRWLVRQAQRMDHVSWALQAQMPKAEKDKRGRLKENKGRDMKGPTRAEAQRLLASAAKDEDPRAQLILSMTRYEGYRIHELRQIDLDDLDLKKGRVLLVRKKRDEPSWYTMSSQTCKAIKGWLKVRGEDEGPLLTGGVYGCDIETSIGASTIWTIVRRVGAQAKVPNMSPHKIRHRACTDIVDQGMREGWPEEEILYYTGHSSRAALQPYYEALKSSKSARKLFDSFADLTDDED